MIDPAPGGLTGPIGEHIVAVGNETQHFYRESSGAWAEAGTLTLPPGYQAMSMSDDWLAVRRAPGEPGFSGDGEVRIYAIASGPTVTATLAATLAPDPSWPVGLREGFGRDVVVDGDLAVVSAVNLSAATPGTVRVSGRPAASGRRCRSWAGPSATPPGSDRPSRWPTAPPSIACVVLTYEPLPVVRIYVDAGSGFALEQELLPAAPLPGASQNVFGSSLSIDGDLLAMAGDATAVASADPGHLPVNVAARAPLPPPRHLDQGGAGEGVHHPARRRGQEHLPLPGPGLGSARRSDRAGDADPPPGCGFFCFNIGFEAWSLDRR